MKKFNLYIVVFASLFAAKVTAQVNTNLPVQNNVANSNAFFDASTNFNTSASSSPSIGKGLVFPDTDLTQFEFDLTLADGITFPSYFDGMLVFNTGTGSTADPSLTTQTTGLAPGWYYFSNPNGLNNGSVAAGKWLPVGGSPKVDVLNTETTTNNLINGRQVYARRGTFTTNGTSTAPTGYSGAIVIPAAGSMYRITVFQTGTNNVYANGVYSYDKATGNLITGSPSMSVVYPNGTYEYIVEYTKL